MQYAKIKNDAILEFPSYPQRNHPSTSFAEGWTGGDVEGSTYVMVEIEDTPPTDYLTQDTEAKSPKKVQGKWIQKITVVQISEGEKKKRKAEQETQDTNRNDRYLTPDEIKAIRKLLKAQV